MAAVLPGYCDNSKCTPHFFKGCCNLQLRRQPWLFTSCNRPNPPPSHTHWSSSVQTAAPLLPPNPKIPWEWGRGVGMGERGGNHQLLDLCCHFWIFKPLTLPVFHHLTSLLSLMRTLFPSLSFMCKLESIPSTHRAAVETQQGDK